MPVLEYGPYRRKDGRSIVVFYDTETGRTTSRSYPRVLMERKLGRALTDQEEVDHVNNDKTDDRESNFQILTPRENTRKRLAFEGRLGGKVGLFVCPSCQEPFTRKLKKVNPNMKFGPFCTASCAGQWRRLTPRTA